MIWIISKFAPEYGRQLVAWFYILLMILALLLGLFFAFVTEPFYLSSDPFE